MTICNFSRFHDVATLFDFFMHFHCIYLHSLFHDVATMGNFSCIFTVFWVPWCDYHWRFFLMYFHCFFFIISSKWMDEELWEQDKDLNRKPWIVYVQSNLHPPRPSWSWSYMVVGFTTTGAISVLSPLKLLIRTMFMARCNRYNIMW